MDWPYAYARGLTKLQMTKTGLTSLLPQEKPLLTCVLCFHVLKGTELFLFRNYVKILTR